MIIVVKRKIVWKLQLIIIVHEFNGNLYRLNKTSLLVKSWNNKYQSGWLQIWGISDKKYSKVVEWKLDEREIKKEWKKKLNTSKNLTKKKFVFIMYTIFILFAH